MKYIFLSGKQQGQKKKSKIFSALAVFLGLGVIILTQTVPVFAANTIVPGPASRTWPANGTPFAGYFGRGDNQFSSFFCYRNAQLVGTSNNNGDYTLTYKYSLDTNDSAMRIETKGQLLQEKGSIVSSTMNGCVSGDANSDQTSNKLSRSNYLGDKSATASNSRWTNGTIDLNSQQYRTDFSNAFSGASYDQYSFSSMRLNSASVANNEINYWCGAGFLNGGGGRDTYGSIGGTNSGKSECGPVSGAGRFSVAAQYGYAFINDGGLVRIDNKTVFCSGMPVTSLTGGGLNLNLDAQISAGDNCGPDVKSSGKNGSFGCDCTGFLSTRKYNPDNGQTVQTNAVNRLSPLYRGVVENGDQLTSAQIASLQQGSLPRFNLQIASVNALDGYGDQWVNFNQGQNCFNTATACAGGAANNQQAGTAVYVSYTFAPKAGVVPSIAATPQMTPRQGTITVKSTIANNSLNNADNNGLRQRVTRIIVPNGQTLKRTSPVTAGGDACGAFANNGQACVEDWQSNPAPVDLKKGDSPKTRTLNDTAGDIPFGGQVCYITSVNKYATFKTENEWSYSDAVCVRVAKRPSVKIYANDLWAAGNVSGQINDMGNPEPFFGSSSQYGVFANGSVNGFASAGGLFGGARNLQRSASGNNLYAPSTLTFANSDPTDLGKFASTNNSVTSLASTFSKLGENASGSFLNLSVDNMKQWSQGACNSRLVYNINSPLVIDQAITIPTKCSVVIVSRQPVTIKANITYADDSVSSPADLPQLVIVAPNINIESSVTRVDSWLFAYLQVTATSGSYGTINTCSDVSTLNTAVCNTQLIVHGYVAAAKYLLKRTFGSDGQSTGDDAAEIFNAGADATLWQKYQIGDNDGGNSAITQMLTQLPPRY